MHHIHAQLLEFLTEILLVPPYGNLHLKAVPVHGCSKVAEGALGAAQAEIRDQMQDLHHRPGFTRSTSTSGIAIAYQRPPTLRRPADPATFQTASQAATTGHSHPGNVFTHPKRARLRQSHRGRNPARMAARPNSRNRYSCKCKPSDVDPWSELGVCSR